MNKKGKIAVLCAVFFLAILFVGLAIAKPGAKGPKPECNDKIDNDGDGAKDMADGGCDNRKDNDESNCGDGVCEGGETPANCQADCGYPDSCSDTDGGNVISIFGTTSGYFNNNPYSNDDYCVDAGNIMEYYCSGDYEQSQQQSCGTDGYGSDYCQNGSVYRDYSDYYCSSGACYYSAIPELVEECYYGCTNGTCDPMPDSCSDTDGGWYPDFFGTVSGYLNEQPYSNDDYCVSNTTLKEYYCIGDYSYNWNFDCIGNFTACVNDACI